MHLDWWTLALQTVNFLILVWLLHRFLYRPVLRMIDKRRSEIGRQYDEADKLEEARKAALAEVAQERAGMAGERKALLDSARAEAGKLADARHAKAQEEAAAMLEEARRTLAGEREAARAETRKAALDLGVEIARRLLSDIPAGLRAEAWLGRIEEHIGGLDQVGRGEIVASLDRNPRVRIVTATALPEAVQADWTERLRKALGHGLEPAFEVDPKLIAGVELHFANVVLRLSWRHALEDIRTEVGGHDDARQ